MDDRTKGLNIVNIKSDSPKAKETLSKKLQKQNIDFELHLGRLVRQTGPNWHQVAIDVQVQK